MTQWLMAEWNFPLGHDTMAHETIAHGRMEGEMGRIVNPNTEEDFASAACRTRCSQRGVLPPRGRAGSSCSAASSSRVPGRTVPGPEPPAHPWQQPAGDPLGSLLSPARLRLPDWCRIRSGGSAMHVTLNPSPLLSRFLGAIFRMLAEVARQALSFRMWTRPREQCRGPRAFGLGVHRRCETEVPCVI